MGDVYIYFWFTQISNGNTGKTVNYANCHDKANRHTETQSHRDREKKKGKK